jgi:TonB family protein
MIAFLKGALLARLGLTILHSLWELAIIALVVWVGLALLRRQGAGIRYALACAGLLAMLLVPLATWFRLEPAVLLDPGLIREVEGPAFTVPVTGSASAFPALVQQALRLAPWAGMIWFGGVLAMLVRLGAGLWWLDHAYLRRAQPAPAEWQRVLDRLAARMGLRAPVRLLESTRADSPLVLGWLKPAILVPSAALLHLNPAALEAILAHELAHVRRADYLVNLLQSVAEALLFFHPCAWWLSRTIRELREHCCDDAAASLCGDPLALAEGLSALEHLRHRLRPDPEPALAAARGKLMSRITRLFQPQNAPSTSLRGLVLTLAGASLLGAAALTTQQATEPLKPKAEAPVAPARLAILHQPPAPPYPAEARAKGIQGALALRLVINAEGLPGAIEVLQGPEELKAAAIAYAKGWRFKLPAGADPEFQLNLLFALKGSDGPSAETLLAGLPQARGASATVEILARAGLAVPTGAVDFDFSAIKIAHQPPAPAYPADAKAARIQGTVVVELVVDEQGVPVSARALEGPPQLAPTAVAYAREWRFEPALVNGKAVQARFKLTMPFRLREDAPAPKTSAGKVDTTPGQAKDTDFSRIKVAYQPPAPAYPPVAKANRIQGTVVVEIIVDEQGLPVGVKALSGPEELQGAAMAYAEDWRFEPFKIKGKPAKARFKLTMPFRLR